MVHDDDFELCACGNKQHKLNPHTHNWEDAFEKWLVKSQWKYAAGYAGEVRKDGSLRLVRQMMRAEVVLAAYRKYKEVGKV